MAVHREELKKIYRFDDFEVDVRKQVLLRAGKAITLNAKTFHLLLALVTSGGRELSKDELMQRVWQEQIVEENNLAVHIYNLRKILGERKDEHRYIITLPGVGYRFVAEVTETASEPEALYIESHTLSRIVVEEDSGTTDNPETIEKGKGEVTGPTIVGQSETSLVLAPPIQAGKRKSLLIAAGLISLFLAAGGYLLYRNFSRAAVHSSAPASQRQMTVTHASNIGRVGAACISPDGKFIAYKQDGSSGAGTIYVQQVDTNTVRPLLEPGDRAFTCLNFSPDGALIYFVVYDKRDPNAALYSVPVLGGTPYRLMSNFSPCFSLSPDGKRVAFYRNDRENHQVHLMIAELAGGGEQVLLTRTTNELIFDGGLAWSPDGNFIAIHADPEPDNGIADSTILGVDVPGGATRPLTSERFANLGKMSWTGDGRHLLFVAKRPGSDNQLYLMDYPAGEVRQITRDMGIYLKYGLGMTDDSSTLVADLLERKEEIWRVEASGDASKAIRVKSGTTNGRLGITTLPDGRIVYLARIGDNLDIWTAKEDGSEAKALTTDSFIQKDVAASPDGRYLVFTSDRAGGNHIFRMNADDGSEVTQLTFGSTSDTHPDVSPDGQWVVYASADGKQSTILKVPLAGGACLRLTDYESGMPVFAPDGKTIACVLPSGSPAKLSTIAIVPAEGGIPIKSFPVKPYQNYNYPIRWTPDGKAITFGKWENNVFNLWQQPLSGAKPRQLTNFPSGSIWNFAYSRDGKALFLSRGTTFIDVVLIKNLS